MEKYCLADMNNSHRSITFGWNTHMLNYFSIDHFSDLSDAIEPFKDILKMTSSVHNMRYGQMVLPYIVNNFGPMYFSKITRTSWKYLWLSNEIKVMFFLKSLMGCKLKSYRSHVCEMVFFAVDAFLFAFVRDRSFEVEKEEI